jgi:hypothetical protein
VGSLYIRGGFSVVAVKLAEEGAFVGFIHVLSRVGENDVDGNSGSKERVDIWLDGRTSAIEDISFSETDS